MARKKVEEAQAPELTSEQKSELSAEVVGRERVKKIVESASKLYGGVKGFLASKLERFRAGAGKAVEGAKGLVYKGVGNVEKGAYKAVGAVEKGYNKGVEIKNRAAQGIENLKNRAVEAKDNCFERVYSAKDRFDNWRNERRLKQLEGSRGEVEDQIQEVKNERDRIIQEAREAAKEKLGPLLAERKRLIEAKSGCIGLKREILARKQQRAQEAAA